MKPFVAALAEACIRAPRTVVALALFSALLCLVFTLKNLNFTVDRTEMLDPRHPVQRDWLAYREQFSRLSDFVVLVRGEPAAAREAVETLAARLTAEPQTFADVLYRFDLGRLSQSSLYYLTPDELRNLSQQLEQARPWLQALSSRDGVAAWLGQLGRPESPEQTARQLEPLLPLLNRLLEGLVRAIETRGQAPPPELLPRLKSDLAEASEFGLEPGKTRFYLTVDNGRGYLLLVSASDRSGAYSVDLRTLARLRALAHQVARQHPGTEVVLTGEPVINADETQAALRDALRAAGLAFVAVAVLLAIAFRAIKKPAAVMLSLLVGIAWSGALAVVAVGRLNLLTVNFVTMLVGLGMSFGIHILYRFQQERAEGREPPQALRNTLLNNRGNLIGAISTAVAFYALYFTSFRSAGQLGVVTGSGMLLCYLSMVTTLPGLLLLIDRGHPEYFPRWRGVQQVNQWLTGKRRAVLVASLLFSLYSLSWVARTPFDYNLMHIQAPDAPALRVERYLQRYHYSALYAVALAPDLRKAQELTQKLRRLPTVGRVQTLTTFWPLDPEKKEAWIDRLISQARPLKVPGPPGLRDREQLERLFQNYLQARQQVSRAMKVWLKGPARAEAQRLEAWLARLDQALDRGNPGPMQTAMSAFETRQFQRLKVLILWLKEQRSDPPPVLESLPPGLLSRLRSSEGKIAVRIFPREDCWERDALGQFVRQLRQLDPHVTGYAVLVYVYLDDMRKAYAESGRNAFIAICLLLLFHFRSPRLTLLAVFPKLLGILWMLGLMGLLHQGFNPINFLALPLTLGIGLIFGVHVLESGGPKALFAGPTGPAIVLSALATIIGFGTLLGGEHPGIASFGLVMVLGVGANLVTSLVTLPALLPEPSQTAQEKGSGQQV